MTEIDLEELYADLLSAEFKTPVERFGPGADGGIDLRWHESGGGVGIVQCKHYINSSFAQLLASARKECPKIEKLKPERYLFATSQPLTANQKNELMGALSPWIKSTEDVLSGLDLDQMLDRHKVVERKHLKLWLSTGTELFWATRAELLNRSEELCRQIEKTITQYVGTKVFEQASDILEREKVCLIAGQPGIGKTVLAHVLLADHMARGFEVIEVSSDIDDAWGALDPERRQVFLYDDFLGQLSFSERMNKNEDSRLAGFIDRVQGMKSKRLVLTTREYILRDAARTYSKLSSVSTRGKYILELTDYSRNDKARILYNHLWQATIDRSELMKLADGGWRRVVDHPNYSPRLIEYGVRLGSQSEAPGAWIDQFVAALDDPSTLWKQSFDAHLTEEERALLYVLVSFERSVDLTALESAHRDLCKLLAISRPPGSFRLALERMEETFLKFGKDHRGVVVEFDNPSVVDFILNELRRDPELQRNLLQAAIHFEQVESLWSRAAASVTVRDKRSSSQAREKVLHESTRKSYSKAIKRTFSADALDTRNLHHDSFSQSREARLAFIAKLPEGWGPKKKWFLREASIMVERWGKERGDKKRAFEITFGADAIGALLPANAASVAERWIRTTLSETEDWLILGELLAREDSLPFDQDFADEFQDHVVHELQRWDPAPPMVEELRELSDCFGLSGLEDDFEEAMQAAAAEDEAAGAEYDDERFERPTVNSDERDETIERYFNRF
ncbi:restriction endonuclease [Salinibacterium sp. M195]|uniref:restriction endonuclease n=1 Tax=Salinibacterium sp. M195 TaxID=2583374 RepID=UPI001C62C37C|nr:restriction endonuclease [Salinibacterium sp. M195]QYH35109.1 restriction endonuclease [Salinibacterium sp. M195]